MSAKRCKPGMIHRGGRTVLDLKAMRKKFEKICWSCSGKGYIEESVLEERSYISSTAGGLVMQRRECAACKGTGRWIHPDIRMLIEEVERLQALESVVEIRHGRPVITSEMSKHMPCPFPNSEPDL